MTETVIDAEVVEGTSTDLVAQPDHSATLFRTDDPVEVLTRATEVADALAPAIEQRKLFASISGKKHITVEGWTTLGAMLGVTPICVWTRKTDDGWEARVEARTLDGRTIGAAEAQCTRSEAMWANRDDYALRSMAQTRATSKALGSVLRFVVTLAGYSGTPAEEMPRDGEHSAPDWKADDDKFADNILPTNQIFNASVHAARWVKNGKAVIEVVVPNPKGGKSARETVWLDPARDEFTTTCAIFGSVEPGSDAISNWIGQPCAIYITEREDTNGKVWRNHSITPEVQS